MTEYPGEWSSLVQAGSIHPQVLVIGLGNPILGDDGLGWRIAEQFRTGLQERQPASQENLARTLVEVDCLSLGGLSLMERLIGYQRAIIIDAATTQENPPGTVTCLPLQDLTSGEAGHTGSAHDTSLQTAIEVGRLMGASLPKDIMLVLVEAETLFDFSEALTPPIEAAIPEAEHAVMQILDSWIDRT